MDRYLRLACARDFYRGDCAAQLQDFLADYAPPDEPAVPVAGIVPHAGWFFSGATAARVWKHLAARRPQTKRIVLLGAVHRWGVHSVAVYPTGEWETPLGSVRVDEEFAAALVDRAEGQVVASSAAHMGEHSIEVQLPMVRHLLPKAAIVPIAVPPATDAVAVGKLIAAMTKDDGVPTVVVGSTDLTHYGPDYGFAPAGVGPVAAGWMRANDERIIGCALALDAPGVLEEAACHQSACGPGAFAATVAAASGMGAESGTLLHYTNSHEVLPRGEFATAVGYAGIVF